VTRPRAPLEARSAWRISPRPAGNEANKIGDGRSIARVALEQIVPAAGVGDIQTPERFAPPVLVAEDADLRVLVGSDLRERSDADAMLELISFDPPNLIGFGAPHREGNGADGDCAGDRWRNAKRKCAVGDRRVAYEPGPSDGDRRCADRNTASIVLRRANVLAAVCARAYLPTGSERGRVQGIDTSMASETNSVVAVRVGESLPNTTYLKRPGRVSSRVSDTLAL